MTATRRLRRAPDGRTSADTAGPARADAPGPERARILALQGTAGNAAVSALLGRGVATVAREPDGAAPAATPAPSPLDDLAERAGSPAALRAMVLGNPALGQQIASYFAGGGDNPALNALMSQAFTSEAAGLVAASTGDKDPTDPAVALPAPVPGEKKLDKGTMTWTLQADGQSAARCDVSFASDSSKVEAKSISFGQTVVNTLGTKNFYAGATPDDPEKNKATYQPFEDPVTKKRMDHMPDSENDPFYGAEWDQGAKKWKDESADWIVGSSKKGGASKTATMYDVPGAAVAREGLGDASKEFETVPMVLETRQPLGALRWGFRIKDEANAPIELTGGQDADCTDTPSADWAAAMDQYYAGKFEEILDDFDVGKHALKPDHRTKLDSVATKMTANAALKAQLGGAADLTGSAAVNQALSRKRAEAARDYLVGKGIDVARLEVQSYGADWARVETEAGKEEAKNRRVQIWLH